MTNTKLFDSGAYIEVDSPTIKGWHSCGFKELLANQDPEEDPKLEPLTWIGGPVPKAVTGPILAMVKQFPHREVHICLYYNPEEKLWMHHFPKQNGTAAHVYYNDESYDPPKGYYFAGTMHTHPNLGAFFSGEDQSDQRAHNGLHFVLGLVDGKLDDWKINLSYHGSLYPQDKALLEVPEELPEPDKDELKRLQEEVLEPPAPKAIETSNSTYEYNGKSFYDWQTENYQKYLNNKASAALDEEIADRELDEGLDWLMQGCDELDMYGFTFDILKSCIKFLNGYALYVLASLLLKRAGEPALAEKVEEALMQTEESDSWNDL